MSASVKKKTSSKSKSGRAGTSRSRSSRTAAKKASGRKSAQAASRSSVRKTSSSRQFSGRSGAAASRSSSRMRTGTVRKQPASSAKTGRRSARTVRETTELTTVWIDIVLLMVTGFSLMLLLGNFGRAGFVGNRMSAVCFGLFGVMEYVFPFLFLMGSFFYAANRFNRLIMRKMTGLTLIFLFLCAISQLFGDGFVRGQSPLACFETAYVAHSGGGLLGGLLVLLFGTAFGAIGAELLAIIGLFIGLLMLTQKPILHSIGRKGRVAAEKRRIRRDVRREEYEQEEARREMDFESLKEQVRREEEQKLGRERKNGFQQPSADIPDRKEASASVTSIPSADGRPELDMPLFGRRLKTGEERKYEAAARSGAVTDDHTASISDIRTGQILPQEKKELPEEGFGFPSFLHVRHAAHAAEPALQQDEAKKESRQAENESPAGAASGQHVDGVSTSMPERSKAETAGSGYRMDPVTGEILGAATKDIPEDADVSLKSDAGKQKGTGDTAVSKTEQASARGDALRSMARDARKKEQDKKQSASASGRQMSAPEVRRDKARGTLPPFDLLTPGENTGAGNTPEHAGEMEHKLVQTLAEFGVEVTPTRDGYSVGPTVTRYELKPGTGVKVSRIVNLQDDIKLALEAPEIRIEAPIPGKAAVGIEVPNKEPQTVPLRELLEAKEFRTSRARLAFAVGRNIEGKPVIADIEKMPHLLIAGATGSGKSVCINTLIMSLLYKYTPEEVRLLLIDPKVVELKIYDGIPHLLIPVVTDAKKAAGALNWAVQEMTSRYNTFAKYTGVRDIKSYNKKVEELAKAGETDEKLKKMPRIVIIVDELADLMMVASQDVEDAICRLAQLARAAGIHLVVATQRPSVNVVTGQIKANMPSRIALAVTSGVDSRTILDMNGAEKLLGRGDMLYYPQGYTKPARVQGAYVSDSDIARVVDFLTAQSEEVAYNKEVEESIATSVSAMTNGASLSDDGNNGRDEYFAESGRLIIQKEKASIGMLQRAFKIGFNRAARIMDQLCEAGVVGGEEGTKPRKILMTSEQFEQMLSSE